ncbi:MAG: preprotein translocase subunit SecF [Candidatus Saganbacteria bacterium]|uniref:Protein-export membrane protein SecF n=1 Tax=Candidatus Saganbacteria bacterium TaxID=2575572 RepID=A0A833L072_UNCSA|nr:MAG: preprotein translocase subunit SecF [Candidatus Saganbacteria bacterium]
MNIIGKSKLWFLISGVLIAASIAAMVFNGMVRGRMLNFGIDFTGGSLINLRFNQQVDLAQVRAILKDNNLGEAMVQRSGEKDVLIKSEPLEMEVRKKVVEDLGKKFDGVELLEADTVGPVIGAELKTHAILALIIAAIGILLYVSFRFEFIFAAAGVLALLHDAIITTGFMALFYRNLDISFIAGILTILGYSINDTVVIFDRIRENMKKPGAHKKKFAELVNQSILETMARSINTVLTVVVMVLALLFFGGEPLKDLCMVLLVGFLIGTYSSIFIASPLVVLWEKRK